MKEEGGIISIIFPKSDSSIWHMYDYRYSGQLKMLTNKNNKKKAKKRKITRKITRTAIVAIAEFE